MTMELADSLIFLGLRNSTVGEMPVETVSRALCSESVIRHCLFSTRAKICPLPTRCLPSNPHDTDWTQ